MRFALLSAHYRQPLDWTEALLAQSKATLDRLYNALRRIKDAPIGADQPANAAEIADQAVLPVREALCDDLNTPQALAELSAIASEANKAPESKWSGYRLALVSAGYLLGLLQRDPDDWARGDTTDAARIDALVAARVAARKAKDFAEADRIRKDLAAEGIEIMDGPDGSTWRRV
jgi:cysteinyl-tRNA synthetase